MPISGGLDSSVVASLCVKAVGANRVVGLMMPERFGNPEALTYGRLIARHLGIQTKISSIDRNLRSFGASNAILSLISGRPFWQALTQRVMRRLGHSIQGDYLLSLQGNLNPQRRRFIATINTKHRIRMVKAFKYAEEHNLLVVGATHKTEKRVGMFCKFGVDDCADLMPIQDLYRAQILQLAQHLDVPQAILQRFPNPDILPGIVDKYRDCFGVSAEAIDVIVYAYLHKWTTVQTAQRLALSKESIQRMMVIIRLNHDVRIHNQGPKLQETP